MKHQSSFKAGILLYISTLLMYFSAKYQLCIFSSWKMTGRLQLCYLMYDLCSKLQLLSIWSILFRGEPPYGWKTSLAPGEPFRGLPRARLMELSAFGRLRSAEAQACNNPGVADQKRSGTGKQYPGWLLSTRLQYISFYRGAAGCAIL